MQISSLARKCPQRRPPGGPLVGLKGRGLGDLPLLSEPGLWCEGIFPSTHLSSTAGHCFHQAGVCVCVCVCVCGRGGGHFSAVGSNTNYSTIWWSAPSQSPLTLLPEETCCARRHGLALWHMSFIRAHTHTCTGSFALVYVCVRVCNRWEWRGIVRGGSAEMCSPVRSLYPPVLTPLGGRPPGNKSRLFHTLPPPITHRHTHTHTHTHTHSNTHTEHTPSQWSTKNRRREKRRGVQREKNGEGEREMGGSGWRILEGWKEMLRGRKRR